MTFYPFLLTYHTKDYIWGGTKLKENWNKSASSEKIAECWELCINQKCNTYVKNGKLKGEFSEIIEEYPEILGKKGMDFIYFPLLIKLINAELPLSVQVHPDDEYALNAEGQYGKCEMWYICDADEGAEIYLGLNKDITKEQLSDAIESGDIEKYLNTQKVKAGEYYVVPTGTLHAIKGGITLLEVQQNSDITYRIYDYNRTDANGKKRELHIEKAIDVIDYNAYTVPTQNTELIQKDGYKERLLAENNFFVVKEMIIDKKATILNKESFESITVVDGEGKIGKLSIKKGDTIFLPADTSAEIEGNLKIITASV